MTKKNGQSYLKPWLVVLVALLDDIAALALVFVILWFFGIKLSPAGIVVISLVLGAFVFIVHRAIVPSLRRRKVTGAEGMVGLTGEVMETLTPKGAIRIDGEYWKARSVDGEIDVDEEVEITAIKGLELEVRRRK